ncbi:hypothetical protein PS903_02124 [Pseudomonas fluorescens]|nr:hypothetical protein PS903_02124 [Pseudomonas fluorescens]
MPTITIPDDENEPDLFDPAPGPAPEQYDLFTEVPTSQDALGEAHKEACGVCLIPIPYPLQKQCRF